MGGSANLQAAVALFDRVIEINTTALGADHIDTAATMQQKAKALVDMGGSANLQAAVALYDRVIEINTTALGADHTIHSRDDARQGERVGRAWVDRRTFKRR
jgi:hypothetical protein